VLSVAKVTEPCASGFAVDLLDPRVLYVARVSLAVELLQIPIQALLVLPVFKGLL